MRPIRSTDQLVPRTTLYHSAFGFASVSKQAGDHVELEWERSGAHLPRSVRFEHLRRVYALCPAEGFFHRAVHKPEDLRQTLHSRPADALVWLLDDLGESQSLQDVMDWLVGRDLFTAKTFVRWWADAQGPAKADSRLQWRGDRVSLSQGPEPTQMHQLAPGLVDTELDVDLEDEEDTVEDADITARLASLTTETGELTFANPVSIGEAELPRTSFAYVGRALASSLARAHAEGQVLLPNSFNTVIFPDGRIQVSPADAPPADHKPIDDVFLAGKLLLESFLGRALPAGAEPHSTLPFLRHQLSELGPAVMAPLTAALHPEPEHRPTASRWLTQWKAVVAAEEARPEALDAEADLRCGYDSHVGRVKLLQTQINQDALWIGARGQHRMFALADGISVADAGTGDIASRITVRTLGRVWESSANRRHAPRRLLDAGLHLANREVCQQALRFARGDLTDRQPMGTTATVLATEGNRVHLSWLGDSRAYLIGEYGVSLLTADDNVSGQRFASWCEHVASSWNDAGHALVRYVGHFDEAHQPAPLPAHHVEFVLRPNERVLLCTDGITDYLHAHEPGLCLLIEELCQGQTPHEACRQLVAMANRRGGGDNASVILIEAERVISEA